jgi:hypothetical protein
MADPPDGRRPGRRFEDVSRAFDVDPPLPGLPGRVERDGGGQMEDEIDVPAGRFDVFGVEDIPGLDLRPGDVPRK